MAVVYAQNRVVLQEIFIADHIHWLLFLILTKGRMSL